MTHVTPDPVAQCPAVEDRPGTDLHYCILEARHGGGHCCYYGHTWVVDLSLSRA